MKTILAVLMFALVAGQSLPDQARSFFDRIVGRPSTPAGLTLTVTPSNFGSNLRPGDQVRWVIDVQNPSTTGSVEPWEVVQTTSNLSPTTAQVSCRASDRCPSIGQPTVSGNTSSLLISQSLHGAHATITETAAILNDGPFSVVVRAGPQFVNDVDRTAEEPVVATLPGQTVQSTTTPASNSTDQGTGLSNGSNVAGPPAESRPGQPIRVTWDVAPGGAYQVGEGVTADFAFWNDGDAPQTIAILGNKPSALRLSAYRRCGPRCSFVVPAKGYILWSVDAVIIDGPGGRAPSSFSDTVHYRVGRGAETSSTASGKLGAGFLTWLALGGIALAAVAATALGVNRARRAWWDHHISVNAEAHADEAVGRPGAIREYVAVHVERGAAAPRGPIPIIRIDLDG